MDDGDFLEELEQLEKADQPHYAGAHHEPTVRRRTPEFLHERGVFIEPEAPIAEGRAATRIPLAVSVVTIVACMVAGAGAAAFVFADRLARILH